MRPELKSGQCVSLLGVLCLCFVPSVLAQNGGSYSLDVPVYGPAEVVTGQDGTGTFRSEPFDSPAIVADPAAGSVPGPLFLVLENGVYGRIEPGGGGMPDTQPPGTGQPADKVEVSLNGKVVLKADAATYWLREEVGLQPHGNVLELSSAGAPGAAVRVGIVQQTEFFPTVTGSSTLVWASNAQGAATSLMLGNLGPSEADLQVTLLQPDGTSAGTSHPQQLAAGASTVVKGLGALATETGGGWTAGSVRVDWTAQGDTRLSGYATEVRPLCADGSCPGSTVRTIALEASVPSYNYPYLPEAGLPGWPPKADDTECGDGASSSRKSHTARKRRHHGKRPANDRPRGAQHRRADGQGP